MMFCVPMFVGAQTLTFTDHEPMGNMRTQVPRQFFRLIEQESKGRIRIDHHWNGELSSSYDGYETVREGTKADMATVVPEYDNQRMPLHQLFKSFLAGPSGEAQVALIRKAYKTIPELTEELHHAGIHPVLVATGYPVGFYSREPMADLNALKEQTWRTASFWHISYLENAGATNKRHPLGRASFRFAALRSHRRHHGEHRQRMGHRCPPCCPSPVGVAGTLVRAHLFSGDEPRPMECPAPEGQASHRACGKQDLQGDGQDDG